MSKKRKILSLSEDTRFFNLDIRVSIPKSQISQELVDDLLNAKDDIINGTGNQIFFAKINQDEEGNDKLEISTDYYYGVE
jgi:hypothetical protein